MSLRDQALTAMGRGIQMGSVGSSFSDAELALDALLDYLDAHTEEWIEAEAQSLQNHRADQLEQLIAALRVEP